MAHVSKSKQHFSAEAESKRKKMLISNAEREKEHDFHRTWRRTHYSLNTVQHINQSEQGSVQDFTFRYGQFIKTIPSSKSTHKYWIKYINELEKYIEE